MEAEIIAIGTELLGAEPLETNSLFLTRELAASGIRVTRKSVLPDDLGALTETLRERTRRAALVICCGGLGPTDDDRTRSAAAAALGRELILDVDVLENLRRQYAQHRRSMPEIARRQAYRLAGAEWLPNLLGTAWGLWCPTSAGVLVLLPGPTGELQHVFDSQVRPRLGVLAPGSAFFTRVLSIVGMSEAEVDAVAAPIYRHYTNPATTILATGVPQVELHFHSAAPTSARAQTLADQLAAQIEERLGLAVFSRDQESLAAVVGRLLRAQRQTLAVAESCTGGLLSKRLTDPPGASEFFQGGVVCYSDRVKQETLGVPASILRRHGAVSSQTALAMARGVRERLRSDWSVAITGIAGPGGGSVKKPVGTVFIAADDGSASVARFLFGGDRDAVRRAATQRALDLLRRRLLQAPVG